MSSINVEVSLDIYAWLGENSKFENLKQTREREMDWGSGSKYDAKASKYTEADSLSKYTDLVRFFHGPYSSIFRAKTRQPIYSKIAGGADSKCHYQTSTTPGSPPVHQVALKLALRDGLPRPHSITRELNLIRLLQGRGCPPSTNRDDGRKRIICALSSFLTESKDTQTIYLAIVEPFYQQGDLGSWLKLQRQGSSQLNTAVRLEDDDGGGGGLEPRISSSNSTNIRRPVKMRQPLLRHALTRCVIRDITRALGWVHSLGVIHRDVKPQNILLAYNIDSLNDYYTTTPKQLEVFDHIPLAILTDFGISWRAEDCPDEGASSKLLDVGTRAYRAPELLFAWSSYGTELDIWSLACVMAELYMNEGDQDLAKDPNPNKDISCRQESPEEEPQGGGENEDDEVFYDQETTIQDGGGAQHLESSARESLDRRAKVRAEMFGLNKAAIIKPPPVKVCSTFFNDGDGGPGSDFCLINSIFKKLGTPSFDLNKAIETAGSKWHEEADNSKEEQVNNNTCLPPTFWPDSCEFSSFKYFDFHSYVRQDMARLLPAAPQPARDLLDKWLVYQASNRMSMLEALSSEYLRLKAG